MAKTPQTLAGRTLAQLGSFWLAVALLVNLFLLTWLGTLEQVEKGIHQVQEEYFESWIVFAKAGPVRLLLPGGYITIGLFTLNLLVGGLVRIRKSRRTVGVIIAHVGIALMMLGGLVEHATSVYGRIVLHENEEGGEFEEYAGWELVLWDSTQTRDVQEYTVPEAAFAGLDGEGERELVSEALPFRLVATRYMRNARPVAVGAETPPVPSYGGFFLAEQPRSKKAEADLPGLYLRAESTNGRTVGESFLFGRELHPWLFEAGGKVWAAALRHRRHDMPFRLRLEEFTKDDHPGIAMARAYSSAVVRVDGDGSEVPVLIEMNKPLRSDGLIVYQASYGPPEGVPGEPYSVLAVSKNPSDRIPWISVSVIALGLIWTFLDRLLLFLGKERRRSARPAAAAEGDR
jgi:hypothetical protein